MPFVTVAQTYGQEPLNMYYEVHGSGPIRVVLIGGFGNICHQWDLQIDSFMQEPDVYSVCIFDNRGGGLSSSPKGRYKTHEMAMDVKELMDHLQWHRFHVVGLSLGGMIAQELGEFRLTLESTFAYFNGLPTKGYMNMVVSGPPLNTVDEFAAHVVGKLLFPQEWLDLPAPESVPFATNREHMIDFVKDRFSTTGLQSKPGRASQQSAVLTHSMSAKRLAHIKNSQMPVLIITGGKLDDVIIQPASSQYLAKHLGARLELFETAGHAIRLQYPEEHNVLLKEHILGAVEKEKVMLEDRVRSALAILKGVCGGEVYEARAKSVREEMEREFWRNGGRHHLVVHPGQRGHQRVSVVGKARSSSRTSLRRSITLLRRKQSGASLSRLDGGENGGEEDGNGETVSSGGNAGGSVEGLRNRKSRVLSLSSSAFTSSLHDLFAPTEVQPSTDSISAPAVNPTPVPNPSSSKFFSWLFPSIPPMLTIEREVVVEPVEFGPNAFARRDSNPTATSTTRVSTVIASTAAAGSTSRDSDEEDEEGEQEEIAVQNTWIPSFRAVRVGFTDVVALVAGRG
ncbi:hypothetical protein HDU98_005457 [Podochytrium sp. JEL0797]|nr:hypothetical protein HDU98_005455 [Podochytrium sp. JEL0797]KAJ3071361.1 hypothetical protein HDU98_005457 [Podochytrium sp. JEL0797]